MRNRANPENCRALNRKYLATDKGKAARQRAQERYRAKHRLKLIAHGKVAYAIKTGELLRQPCWACGEIAQAHHPDYSRPLDVVWLCDKHHKEVHAMERDLRSQSHVNTKPGNTPGFSFQEQ